MMECRRVAIAIGLMLAATVSAVHSQDGAVSGTLRVRPLSSFESVYVPDDPDRASDPAFGTQSSRLTRELRERLIRQGPSRAPAPYPLPFYWMVVDSIGRTTARTVIATAKPDPLRRSDIVVEFADTEGNSIGAVHSRSIEAAMSVLNTLSSRTTEHPGKSRASQPVWGYPVMHLSYHSPIGGNDDFNLLARMKAALRKNGPWTLVDALPSEGDPRRARTVQCFMWHVRGSLPTTVSLRCSVSLFGATAGAVPPWDSRRAEHVLFMAGASCKGCISTDVVFSTAKTRAITATDDLARDLLEHVELEQRIYSPQRGERSR